MKKEPETFSMYTFRRFILSIMAGVMGLFLAPYPSFGNQWTQLTPTGAPGNKDGQMMVYDSQSDRIVMFGDHDACPPPNMTWIFDPQTNTWTSTTPSPSPPGVGHFAMAYDVDHDRVFIYGGQTGTGCGTFSDELWAYNTTTSTWENMNTRTNPPMSATRPTARWGNRMVYDTVAHKLIMYGCFNTGCGNNVVWAYDYTSNTWENRTNGTISASSILSIMVYDAPRSRTLIMSDVNSNVYSYVYSTNTWSQVTTSGTAPATGSAPPDMVYDTNSNRIFFLEDRLGGSGSSRTFIYNPSIDTWANANVPTPSPTIHHAAMAHVSSLDRIILYGGESVPGTADQTWSYNFDSGTTDTQAPSTPSGLSATAISSSQINLSWNASTDNVGVAGYRVYREGTQIAITTTTFYFNTALTPSTTYTYTVAAFDVAGNTSPPSDSVLATTLASGNGGGGGAESGGGGCGSLKPMNPQSPQASQVVLELALFLCPIFVIVLRKWRRLLKILSLPEPS